MNLTDIRFLQMLDKYNFQRVLLYLKQNRVFSCNMALHLKKLYGLKLEYRAIIFLLGNQEELSLSRSPQKSIAYLQMD